MQAVQSIYAHHVLHGLGTFETEPPDAHEMRARIDTITASDFPYLVADDAAGGFGYAYATTSERARPIATRSRTRFTLRP